MSIMNVPSGGTVLVATNDGAMREILTTLLRSIASPFIEATDSTYTIRVAQQQAPDLVLLDLVLEGADGFTTCQQIRTTPAIAEIPVILIAAAQDAESRLQGLRAGADHVLGRPLNLDELRLYITNTLQHRRYRQLVEERTKFAWIAERTDTGYLIIDAQDRLLYASAAARRYLNLPTTTADLPSQPFLALAQQTYQCQPHEAWAYWPMPTPAQVTRYMVLPETLHSRTFWLQVEVLPLSGGNDPNYLVSLHDVSTMMELQHNIRGFQTLVIHKLRTPLVGILGSLELLSTDPEVLKTSMTADLVNIALQSARRLHSDVADVISYLQSESHIDPYPGLVLQQLGARVQMIASNLGLGTLPVTLPAELALLRIALPPRTLDIILYELLDNAIKFHPTRSPQVRIDVRRSSEQHIEMLITDDGQHLSPEQLGAALLPYYQGEKTVTGEVQGMGLGLSTVMTLLWRNGSRIALSNRSDRPGVVITLSIPLSSAATPPTT